MTCFGLNTESEIAAWQNDKDSNVNNEDIAMDNVADDDDEDKPAARG